MDENSRKSLLYCSLLALQFGLQPILASKFTASGVSKTSVVIATELAKIFIAVISLVSGPRSEVERILRTWSLSDSIRVAALPATLYAIQNVLVQYGYIFLDSMTFNLLNQTKVHLLSCQRPTYRTQLTVCTISDPVGSVLVVGSSGEEAVADADGRTVHASSSR
jgi:hydroxymethylpyrimidine/phosphomethylpyrimidine kinase